MWAKKVLMPANYAFTEPVAILLALDVQSLGFPYSGKPSTFVECGTPQSGVKDTATDETISQI
jgi:hypothetical protein